MPCVTRRLSVPLLVCISAILAGCASPKAAYEREDFAQNDVFSRTFPTASNTACDAGRRALLSQGYNIDRFDPARVSGHKNFQGEDGQHTQINFNIDCASDGSANQRATVFANAVQDRYSIKRTTSSASVGVSVLGQVSMPFGSSDDSLVKTASQTVSRPKFYEGFFQLLQRFLPDAEAAAAPHVPTPSRARGSQSKPLVPADPVVSPDAPADTLNPAAANGPSPAPGAAKAPEAALDKAAPAAEAPHATPPSTAGNTESGSTAATPAATSATNPATTPATNPTSATTSATTPGTPSPTTTTPTTTPAATSATPAVSTPAAAGAPASATGN